MNYIRDKLSDGRSISLFNVINDLNGEAMGLQAELSPPSERVICLLDQVIVWHRKANVIRADNVPEFVSGKYIGWATKHHIYFTHIQPNKLQKNTFVERFTRNERYVFIVALMGKN